MAVPRHNYDPRRVCLNPFPNISLGKHRRTVGIYLAGGLVCVSLLHLCSNQAHAFWACSSRSRTGRSSTPRSSPRMRTHPTTNRSGQSRSTSPSSTGCLESAPSWACSSSTSSTRTACRGTRTLGTRARCGALACSCSLASRSWRADLRAVWYVSYLYAKANGG